MIPVYKPYKLEKAAPYLQDAIDSTWISARGFYLDACKAKLEEMINAHVLLVANGTCATHLLAKSLLWKLGKETIDIEVPNSVYIAAINSFLFDDKFNLFVDDVNLETWNANVEGNRDALLVVHNLGNIVDVKKIQERFPNLPIVEDNCEGFLGKYGSSYVGTESLASSISFFGNKNITSGEGGAFVTKDKELYDYIKRISTQGQSQKKFVHDVLGFNYRITNLQAALLYSQLEMIDEIIGKKRELFMKYKALESNKVVLQKIEENTTPSNWMFAVRIIGSRGYDEAERFFGDKGIEIRPMFYPLSTHDHIRDNDRVVVGNEESAQLLSKECVVLPSHPALTDDEISYIIDCVREFSDLNRQD